MEYLDLSSLIEIEPKTTSILELIDNEDLIEEFVYRIKHRLITNEEIKEILKAIKSINK